MEFYLTYRGPLKASGRPLEKQTIRRIFHKQLQELWLQAPLSSYAPPKGHYLDEDPPETSLSIIQRIAGFRFAPLVTERLHLVADLDITMLRPEPPGSIVTQGGDIDNRLKTLLDSLKMPKEVGEVPRSDSPGGDEDPFFCLLEDDNLITKLTVGTGRLLEPRNASSNVVLIIHVRTKATQLTYGNIDLA